MAVTVLKKGSPNMHLIFEGNGNMKMKHVTIDLGVYATNGVPVTAADFGFDVLWGIVHMEPLTTNIKTLVYDPTNKKIIAYSNWAGTQVSGSTNLAGQLIHALVVGN
jgi:hypothetical protein